ncbi:hypothetical protein [Azohydromonas lata]|nr:hypothetical protein [Azohydromonas lata]
MPFDATANEVVLLPALDGVRRLLVEPAGPRELGHYSFHHSPHPGG